MASRADIANLALTKLGSPTKITSLTDNSIPARALNGVYDLMRKAELRAHNWGFALKRASLPASATVPPWGFSASYPLPGDYLRLTQVNEFYIVPALYDYNTADAASWSIEADASGALCVFCNFSAPLKVRYVFDQINEGTFDALFVDSFACRLAFEVCEQITNSNSKKQAMSDGYKASIGMAIKANAIEKPPALIGDDSWILARL